MTNEINKNEEILRGIGALSASIDDRSAHLNMEDWNVLIGGEEDSESLNRIGGHLVGCRICSSILLEAEDYASRVRDRELLERVTPKYVPDATPSRIILEVAGGRVWVEKVRGGWLLASMDLDVDVLTTTPGEGVTRLGQLVKERCTDLQERQGPLFERERRMLSWLKDRGFTTWTDHFDGELGDVVEGAILRIEALKEQQDTGLETTASANSSLLSEAQMNQLPQDFHIALQLAQTMLNVVDRPNDLEVIRPKVRLVLAMLRAEKSDFNVDEEMLVRQLQALYSTYIGEWSILEGNEDEKHHPWLLNRKATIEWRFWRRYERLLREKKGWVPAALARLDDLTDTILDHIGNPSRHGEWDRKGMVVGSVQSGKTANYVGLISKAADAGYKVIVIMAGLHNNLRSQTQLRVDEGFLGWDTRAGRRIDNEPSQRLGVGKLKGVPWFTTPTLTTNALDGDFNIKVYKQAGVVPGMKDPIVLVVKKHTSVLSLVRMWAQNVPGEGPDGQRIVRGVPLLLIDDEADNASINTAPRPRDANGRVLPDYDVSAINREIRLLLKTFEQKAYIGYTATPFANIFIDPEASTERYGDDLFPRDFIVDIPPSSNYVGPAQVFGLAEDAELGTDETPELPIVCKVDDYLAAFPPKHKKDHRPGKLPDSLVKAIRSFVLSCAARRARGQTRDHNSMLVHVTRFKDVQTRVEELIQEELDWLQLKIEHSVSSEGSDLMTELESLWRGNFEQVSSQMGETSISWQKIQEHLHDAASRITTRKINGESMDTLDYIEHSDGLSVIVIGGDKLSRGLTLEGLTVSYYLRATNMYDTLMQMGRWFGYRPGYLDLCRLYTTEELILWYRHIALADMDLRRQFAQMADAGATPKEYNLKVRTHPGGLMITAANKMRDTELLRVSYAQQLPETGYLYRDSVKTRQNLSLTSDFVASLGEPEVNSKTRGNYVWREVDDQNVANYFARFNSHPHAGSSDSVQIAQYIREQSDVDELKSWTVVLVSNTRPDPAHSSEVIIGGRKVVTTWRDPVHQVGSVYAIRRGRIVNPPDEWLDLSDAEYEQALRMTIARYHRNPGRRTKEPTTPSGEYVRSVRSAEKGLLILYPLYPPFPHRPESAEAVIGYAVSFPGSPTAEGVEYRVSDLYWRQKFDQDEDDDELDT